MPDAKGTLSPEEKTKIQQWFSTEGRKLPACPFCGKPNWIAGDHLVTPIIFSGGSNLMIGGASYPQVMLISEGCGYTQYFNAVVIGIAAVAPKSSQPA